MADGKHTPGPWELKDNGEIVGPDGRPVAYAAASRMTREDLALEGPATANARLIAAAPDLLAALEDLIENTRDCCTGPRGIAERTDQELYGNARAAIKRATGDA